MTNAGLVSIGLNAVIVAVTEEVPRILTVDGPDELDALPGGTLADDPTLELAVRRFVRRQTGLEVGYAEQLYTFGDLSRASGEKPVRELSIAYLALVDEEQPSPGASWRSWYSFLPWEDHRRGRPEIIDEAIVPALHEWADSAEDGRADRATIAFGLQGTPWDGVQALERYELLYQAGLVAEAHRDAGRAVPPGLPHSRSMQLDHRRIAATALSRIRGKLTYRPVVFELLPEEFTLLQLQRVVEALAGVQLHKQNFRRLVERGGLVEATGVKSRRSPGRPAELYRFRREVLRERPRPGVGLPGVRG